MVYGIQIGNFRSIGEPQFIAPFGKINLFVGANNSGKSNILRFINENLASLIIGLKDGKPQPIAVSAPHLRRGGQSSAELRVRVLSNELTKLWNPQRPDTHEALALIKKKLAPNDYMWIGASWPDSDTLSNAETWVAPDAWRGLWAAATAQSGGSLREHWVPELLRTLRKLIPPSPRIFEIPIDRKADHQESGVPEKAERARTEILGGRGIIRALAVMQNPTHATFEDDRTRFAVIQDFVRTVVDDQSATISVTHKQDEILVQLKGQAFLPLTSLGSGIEQVVLHAVAATSASDAIVTFEEPELHLHPVLQRQLMTYLGTTSNQYFISTHSAHLIDALQPHQTFHVRLVDGETVVEKVNTDAHRYEICRDLGYKPSDIVQANCVIWVEGPSDRIYIRHWLQRVDKHLTEHVHYSIMFYAGKLLSHLSACNTDADEKLADLIELRSLNRQVAVVIDSDRTAKEGKVRETKRRVVEEIERDGGFVWVTAGREIENYVPSHILRAAVDAIAPGRGSSVQSGRFVKALPSVTKGSKATVDKVETARKVAEIKATLDLFDLKERIVALSRFIRSANGLPDAIEHKLEA